MQKYIFTAALLAIVSNAQDLTWGDMCSLPTDHDCALVADCSSCRYSWPSDDPDTWMSMEAKCRCEDVVADSDSGEGDDGGAGDATDPDD